MKLNEKFLSCSVGGEQILVCVDTSVFSGMARGNETAQFIVDCLQNETSEDAIVLAMLREYDAPEETVRRDVKATLDKLRSIGAVDE